MRKRDLKDLLLVLLSSIIGYKELARGGKYSFLFNSLYSLKTHPNDLQYTPATVCRAFALGRRQH